MKNHTYWFLSSLIVLLLICSKTQAQPRARIALKAANGQYVCAEDGGGRNLVANRAKVGLWEAFIVTEVHGQLAMRAINGRYVSAEGGGGRELIANRDEIGPWEVFTLLGQENGKVALRAFNGQYVSAAGGGGREVVANGNSIGPWELFELVMVKPLAGKIDERKQPGAPLSEDASPKPWIKTATTDWMAFIPDVTPLRSISTPGTHDSGALHGGPGPKTQSWTIKDQLEAGIRFLDIRVRRTKDSFAIHHGTVFQKQMFGDVMDTVSEFLRTNRREAIVMRIRAEEHTPEEGSQDFATIWDRYKEQYDRLFAKTTDPNVTLGSVRGKVFVVREGWDDSMGINYFDPIFDMQNYFKVYLVPGDGISGSDTAHLDGKKRKINEYLDRAGSSRKWVINYLTGSFGTLPILLAGFTNKSAYEHIGPHAYNKALGTVIMDFPGEQLIYRIINSNFSPTCAPDVIRSNSAHSWVEFRLLKAGEGQTIKIPAGAYNHYVFPKCNRVWWTDLTFKCLVNGIWRLTEGNGDADAGCISYTYALSPYVVVGDQ